MSYELSAKEEKADQDRADTHNERLIFLDDILGKEGFEGISSNEGPSLLLFLPSLLADPLESRRMALRRSSFPPLHQLHRHALQTPLRFLGAGIRVQRLHPSNNARALALRRREREDRSHLRCSGSGVGDLQ